MGSIFKSLSVIKNPIKSFVGFIEANISVLKQCTKQRLITEGQVLHGHLYKIGISSHRHVAVKLLIMYLDFRKSAEVDQLLKDYDGFDMIVHNCLISANVDWGNVDEARRLFDEMPERNEVSWTALISGYLKYGRVDESMWLFQRNPFQNVISWTAAISGLLSNGMHLNSIHLFLEMLKSGVMPNNVTLVSIVRASTEMVDFTMGLTALSLSIKLGYEDDVSVCNSLITFSLRLGKLEMARLIFEKMGKRDVISWTAILDMYVEMGDLEEARRVFDEMPERNEVSWSAMISRYTQKGYSTQAINLFRQMIENGISPNSSCLSSAINALSNLKSLHPGKSIHAHITKLGMTNDVFVNSSLIDLYGTCGNPKDARQVFDTITNKNVVCWNSMISAYSSNGQLEESKKLFDQIPTKSIGSWNSMVTGYLGNEQYDKVFEVFNTMLLSGQTPDVSTISSVLCACANLTSLHKGKNIHGKAFKLGFHHDIFVCTSLVDMYAKAGDIENSKRVFTKMPEKNEVSYTAMIQGLAENGYAKESLDLFEEMEKNSHIKPNELILLAILFACSHCGLVNKGLDYFNSMETVYNIKPNERHYTCVVDMLARSGRVSQAEEVMSSMACEPEASAWGALLSGCRTYGEEEIAERVGLKMMEKKAGGYVLLSNVYASSGRWGEVMETRRLMKEKGVKKSGGCSWIEVRNKLHLFYSQDGTHMDFYFVLDLLKFDIVSSKMNSVSPSMNMKIVINEGKPCIMSIKGGKRGNLRPTKLGFSRLCYSYSTQNPMNLRTLRCCLGKENGGVGIGNRDGVIIVDHGSRRKESNLMLNEFVAMFVEKTGYPIVEAAHMELAKPSIKDAFHSCVEKGATRVIVSPFFLFPGRHWHQDIPSLTAEAAKDYPGVSYLVTAPLGSHPLLMDVVDETIKRCLSHVAGHADECVVCKGTGKCRLH
ncbi:hypothetical protein LXL04_023959 [Taraxacum kok-saghyz]